MADTGLAHTHFRLPGTGLIARLPKQSQMQLDAAANLAYQEACYARASQSGHAPFVRRVLPPCSSLPRGGLLVEEIAGRPAALPDDLNPIAEALAAIHSLTVPPMTCRSPLLDPKDPFQQLTSEILAQADYLDQAQISKKTNVILRDGISSVMQLVDAAERPEKRLISFDAHPGNFLIDRRGKAILVDLEKCRYSLAQLDLAHATLYTSTTWDVASHAILSLDEVARTYERWLQSLAGQDWAEDAARWIVPMRRAMWLWSMTWCAKWLCLSGKSQREDADGEDWSRERSEGALVDHVYDRVTHYLAPETADMVSKEIGELAGYYC